MACGSGRLVACVVLAALVLAPTSHAQPAPRATMVWRCTINKERALEVTVSLGGGGRVVLSTTSRDPGPGARITIEVPRTGDATHCSAPGRRSCVFARTAVLEFSSWREGKGADGSYTLNMLDGTSVSGTFQGTFAGAQPPCR